MKRIPWIISFVVVLCAGPARAVMQSYVYEGSLSGWGGVGDGLLSTAGGDWSHPDTTLSWVVDNTTTPGKWHYEYTITVRGGDVQCLIIETSDDTPGPAFTEADLSSLTTNPANWFNAVHVGTQSKWDNRNLPLDMYGIKLCGLLDPVTLTISLDSDRQPTWGDFYARSVLVKDPGGDYYNTLYNAGFMASDPLDPPRNGSVNNHVLVPDTATMIPVPGAVLLAGLGVVCTGLSRRWL